jgi:hypothetical protein
MTGKIKIKVGAAHQNICRKKDNKNKTKRCSAPQYKTKLNRPISTPSAILLGFQNLAGFSYTLKQNRNQENEKDIPNGLYHLAVIDFTGKVIIFFINLNTQFLQVNLFSL